MADDTFQELKLELKKRSVQIHQYINTKVDQMTIEPDDLSDAILDYLNYGGKMLRPGVLLFSCGAVGGDESTAIPAAAAIEFFHTWTLVHDDIIDQDDKRRGEDALHVKYYKRAAQNPLFNLTDEQAQHYGRSISILAGDTQHGMAISFLSDLFFENNVNSSVVLSLVRELDHNVLNTLVSGETLDVYYSKCPIETLTEQQIMAMLWGKTGALYEFAGRAGALIGLNTADFDHKYVRALSTFTSKCGLAFQLLDDILGIVGDENKLGKPVGSDIREGKKTIVLYYALKNANSSQKQKILKGLGHENLPDDEYSQIVELVQELEGISETKKIADAYLHEALEALSIIPDSHHKTMLKSWADFMINRDY